ncbi:MAG: ABC transporter ATP-binding protein [Oscillibacter sp.]|nr:ABC transporter ATP-binding protein [Oscillibacter sp.]
MSEKKGKLPLKDAAAHNRRALSILWKNDRQYVIFLILQGTAAALTPYIPLYFTARLVNELAGSRDPARLWQWLVILLISSSAAALITAAVHRRYWALLEASYTNWNGLLAKKLLDMDFCDVDDPATQALLDQIEQNNSWAGWGFNRAANNFSDLVDAVFRILGAVALSVSLFTMPVPQDSPLAWLNHPGCLAGILGLLLAAVIVSPMLYTKGHSYWAKYDGALGNRVWNFFAYIAMAERQRGTDIRIYQQDEFFRLKADDPACQSFFPNSSIGRAGRGPMGLLMAGSTAVSRVFTGAVYLFVGLKALGGAFGAGSVTQYVGALAGLAEGMTGLLSTLGEMRENAEFLQPAYQFLDTPNNMYQGSLTTEKRSDRKYEIEFRDVSFRYPGTDAWALRHVSMKFRIGERLAVVGENGSGKTTFIKLLCRLYDPTEGEILLNGIDIRKYRYDNYLDLFSVVFQDFRLLAQPLGQNVAAAIEYDRERAAECLKRAGFADRLAELPKGLDTCLYRDFEDDGVEISGGEAQKIALARVLYQDAPFIVLDEPTAALDPEAEAEVYTRFNDIVEDKTAIYISHRLSSCRFCDEIAVFDHGRVVQQGTHDRLVSALGGKYQTLWEAQAQYYQKKEQEAAPI